MVRDGISDWEGGDGFVRRYNTHAYLFWMFISGPLLRANRFYDQGTLVAVCGPSNLLCTQSHVCLLVNFEESSGLSFGYHVNGDYLTQMA